MSRKRKAFVVYVDLDPAPGAFHTAESALNNLRGILENHIGHYDPSVAHVPESIECSEQRPAFVVYVDLDAGPGMMHSQGSAHSVIHRCLRNVIDHYNPTVSLAPFKLQPIPNSKG